MRHTDRHPFEVPLATLVEGANDVSLEATAEELGIGAEEARIEGPVRLEATFFRSDQNVEIQGILVFTLLQECVRCLAPVEKRIESAFRLYCEKKGERDRRSESEIAEDEGLLYHDGRVLKLAEEVRESVLLEVPWHPLCRPDCQGLCPRCGMNRNEGECGCPPVRPHGPWADLLEKAEGRPPQDDTTEKE
ncbi:MAG: DUF177 domain-containing protein [Candidatus Eisenbacteria bacterium]|nr:DUF177 domain-containing protein [Candidatus Eisenbacteria bacterium]